MSLFEKNLITIFNGVIMGQDGLMWIKERRWK